MDVSIVSLLISFAVLSCCQFFPLLLLNFLPIGDDHLAHCRILLFVFDHLALSSVISGGGVVSWGGI